VASEPRPASTFAALLSPAQADALAITIKIADRDSPRVVTWGIVSSSASTHVCAASGMFGIRDHIAAGSMIEAQGTGMKVRAVLNARVSRTDQHAHLPIEGLRRMAADPHWGVVGVDVFAVWKRTAFL
jgi:hypothetical protein